MTRIACRQEQIVEVDVGTEELSIATHVAAVEMHERSIETNRWHGQELFAIVIR